MEASQQKAQPHVRRSPNQHAQRGHDDSQPGLWNSVGVVPKLCRLQKILLVGSVKGIEDDKLFIPQTVRFRVLSWNRERAGAQVWRGWGMSKVGDCGWMGHAGNLCVGGAALSWEPVGWESVPSLWRSVGRCIVNNLNCVQCTALQVCLIAIQFSD